jgi:hypothetical protein
MTILQIPSTQYHDDKCIFGEPPSISNSLIKIMLSKSPEHVRLSHPRLNPSFEQKNKKSFDVGTAWHSLLFEGVDVIHRCDFADWRTKAAQAERDEAYLEGKTPMLNDQADEVYVMVTIAREAIRNSLGFDLKTGGKGEQTICWKEGEAHCRIRTDWISNDLCIVLDGKTTDLSNPNAFTRSIPANGYDIQSAFYKRGVAAENGGNVPKFVFVVQEVTAPYLVYFVELSGAYEATANVKIDKALAIWNACIKIPMGEAWPGYPNEVEVIDPPAWEMAAAEETSITMEGWSAEAFLFGKVRDKK